MTIAHMVIIFLSDSDTIAGVMATPEGKTEGALKTQFGRNHLVHFAFFMALKDTLVASFTLSFHSHVFDVFPVGKRYTGVQFENRMVESNCAQPTRSIRPIEDRKHRRRTR
jgi:hypothetical protein